MYRLFPWSKSSNRVATLLPASLAALVLGGCATLMSTNFSSWYGESRPRDRQVAILPPGHADYWHDVKPILENRCVVCHGCYDAPCQLKLGSIEGIERGASTEVVYNQARLFEASPTRLFDDAQSPAEWRDRGFFPVLNEYDQDPDANRDVGVMYQMLSLKQRHPLPPGKRLDPSFQLGLDSSHTCPKAETFSTYAREHPQWGMPYALPALSADEHDTLSAWLEQGAT